MYYIAYGSNINLEQMAYRCPYSKIIGKGYLNRWKLVFNTHADIIYTDNKSDKVPVLIWEIDNRDWKNLDKYEGYPKYYVKQNIKTHFEDGRTEKCIAYVMAKNRKGFSAPYEDYFLKIAYGYKDNKMNLDYLYNALDYTFKMEDKYYEETY